MDDIGRHPAFSEPARQPEAVTPGLIGNDNALKRPTRFCGLVPPTLQKPEQRVPLRLKFLQRLAVNPGHDPGHKPACLAHLDHHNQGAILLKGSEGSAQVVRLWHGGTSSVLSSDDRASPLAAPHSIYSDPAITTALTLKAVFRLALRQTEGLIGSIMGLLGLALSVPDHTALSRRAETLGGAAAAVGQRCRARAPAGGQHGPEALRRWRVAGREAWHENAPLLAQDAPRRRCRHGPDRRLCAHRPRCP